ncbi:DUF86 domain-containing protein [Halalkalibacter akibai]|uniref:DUF86 domain-containing protein n=1 Tax=Halalkalibacter akibai (strain ATCC 43226 / DSM 21942 / CIP 109018 / JCM 9157 / 1139) TaxID=1236973 RepID=W4QMC0_HALA3|nr:DUF86 domain-containing protein [Halalkalibacter akibai]GAE33270.1 hypothetical protein JCM9157_264 [Halalkalibacter akibai JCM 9157]
MYFVDREKIEQTLVYMETLQELLPTITDVSDLKSKLTLERVAYVLIESIIDVGNSMIDGFIMRDPGGYEDIIDILEDEKVVKEQDASALKEVIGLRKQLIQNYSEVGHKEIQQTLSRNVETLKQFPLDIRRYLVEELGPVSAFLPNQS